MVGSALLLVLSSGRGVSSGLHTFIKSSHSLCSFDLRGGAGPRGFLGTLSQYMLSSAATFSFFLAIGSVCCVLSMLEACQIIANITNHR